MDLVLPINIWYIAICWRRCPPTYCHTEVAWAFVCSTALLAQNFWEHRAARYVDIRPRSTNAGHDWSSFHFKMLWREQLLKRGRQSYNLRWMSWRLTWNQERSGLEVESEIVLVKWKQRVTWYMLKLEIWSRVLDVNVVGIMLQDFHHIQLRWKGQSTLTGPSLPFLRMWLFLIRIGFMIRFMLHTSNKRRSFSNLWSPARTGFIQVRMGWMIMIVPTLVLRVWIRFFRGRLVKSTWLVIDAADCDHGLW